ncbi:hypothetical protein KJA17_02385 [Patescibacteria group bacterium]|nr:hypothetical protein [Patescibacteria group bacterium]
MEFFQTLKIKIERVLSGQFILVIIVVIGLLVYFGARVWERYPETLQTLPATVLKLIKGPMIVEIEEEFPEGEIPETVLPEAKRYIEAAETGDGITHLARRALRSYLSENPQDFDATPEHKIYIEDYLTKQKGDHWLQLGETMELSGDLIEEAIEKSETLSPEQLENLTQYSQLVSSLNY